MEKYCGGYYVYWSGYTTRYQDLPRAYNLI